MNTKFKKHAKKRSNHLYLTYNSSFSQTDFVDFGQSKSWSNYSSFFVLKLFLCEHNCMIMISKGDRSPWAAQIMQRSDGRWTTKVIETIHKLKDNAERVSFENIKTKPLVKREVETYGVVLCSIHLEWQLMMVKISRCLQVSFFQALTHWRVRGSSLDLRHL